LIARVAILSLVAVSSSVAATFDAGVSEKLVRRPLNDFTKGELRSDMGGKPLYGELMKRVDS